MLVVAGLSLANLKPRVWDPGSPYFLPQLGAVMVSYADFQKKSVRRRAALDTGLHAYLGIPTSVKIYLDNGAFYSLTHNSETSRDEYDEFVRSAQPDWWPIPQDFIPSPKMSIEDQRACFDRTMSVNRAYEHDGYTPVIHVGRFIEEYVAAVTAAEKLAAKPSIALGGIVPNLLRAPKALPYERILANLIRVREAFAGKTIHLFGVGGTATLHLTSMLAFNSIDSSGWRNRAARGIIQLPGTGDRTVADLGSWRGRTLNMEDSRRLAQCQCPACLSNGIIGLKMHGIDGFCNRATHNLWVLLQEAAAVSTHLSDGTYEQWYRGHLDNTIYLPLINRVVELRSENAQLRQT